MRYVEAGGVRVSAIGLGTWQFGSREWGYGDAYAETTAAELVHRALDLGVNLIDTAEVYAFGRSERIVGEAVAGRRDEAFLATKVFPVLPVGPVVAWRGRQSARRLGVDVIDLYQVHWPNPVVPLAATMGGMGALAAEGLVRHVGVSNFSADRWRGAERLLGAPVLSNQVSYSLVVRGPERDVLPHAAQADRLVIAYSPLAQGFLSTRYHAGNRPGGVRATNPLFLPQNLERARGLFDALRDVAATHVVTPSQVALAWVIRRPNVVAIPGASSVAQLEANVEAASLTLTDAEDEHLTEAARAFQPVRGVGAWPGLVRARLGR
ncbi:MAG: aldo/keto reductase [Acidimicrobiales bacterium]|nr:aldo/keto reductase [Acidimicrobiales bacterium]